MCKLWYWGGATVEIDFGNVSIVIDPYVVPTKTDPDYVLITHEHYDHFYEPAIKRIDERGSLAFVIASPTCFVASKLDSPTSIAPPPEDLAWLASSRSISLFPHIRPKGVVHRGVSVVETEELRVVGLSSGENPKKWKTGKPVACDEPEAADSSEIYEPVGVTPLPTVGYFVLHKPSGIGIVHPGDLTNNYDELSLLRGQVDVLFLPIGKLNGCEKETVSLIRPRYVVPIHYRMDSPDWPVPITVTQDEILAAEWTSGHPLPGTEWDDPNYLLDVERLIRGHWYPSPTDPVAFSAELSHQVKDVSEVRMLKPGTDYHLAPAGLSGPFVTWNA